MDIACIAKIAKQKIRNHDPLIFGYVVGNYDWGVLRIPHNCGDQSKNLNNDGTQRQLKYRMARRNHSKK